MARFDSGAFDEAEAAFNQVLERSPGHMVALEHLERIRERQVGAPAALATAAPSAALRGGELPGRARWGRARGARGSRESVSGEILVPPEPGEGRSRAAEERADFAVSAKRNNAPARGFLWIGGAVLVLLWPAVGCCCATARALFPNSQEPLQAALPAAVDSIARAKSLHAEGKTAVAIAQLRRLPPQEPQFAEAQSLIAQWEALIKPAEPVPPALPRIANRSASSSSRVPSALAASRSSCAAIVG